jgi:hypothetical protein
MSLDASWPLQNDVSQFQCVTDLSDVLLWPQNFPAPSLAHIGFFYFLSIYGTLANGTLIESLIILRFYHILHCIVVISTPILSDGNI